MGTRTYTPFLRPTRMKHLDGVYKSRHSGKIAMIKNVILRGLIDCSKSPEEPYDGYFCTFISKEEGTLKRCVIEFLDDDWELLFRV
jgi:hypothetical protein